MRSLPCKGCRGGNENVSECARIFFGESDVNTTQLIHKKKFLICCPYTLHKKSGAINEKNSFFLISFRVHQTSLNSDNRFSFFWYDIQSYCLVSVEADLLSSRQHPCRKPHSCLIARYTIKIKESLSIFISSF